MVKLIDWFILGISAIALGIATLWDINYLQYEAPVAYSEYQAISFKDFRGLARPGFTLDGESEFANISTGISIKMEGSNIDVISYFYPCRSYVFARNLQNDYLLKHELYHFHITEYCARLIRKEIKLAGRNLSKEDLSEIRQNNYTVERNLQERYDDETYHSYVHFQQINWERHIDSLLLQYKDFKGPEVKIN